MSHSKLAEQWEAVGEIRDKARKLELATCIQLDLQSACHMSYVTSYIIIHMCVCVDTRPFEILYFSEVEVLDGEVDRDAVRNNIPVLEVASRFLGLRVGVRTCTVHVQALYDYMRIPCPRCFVYMETNGHILTYFCFVLLTFLL